MTDCPECGQHNFDILPSLNGRAHTCPCETKAEKKARKNCENNITCPYCQTCLKARIAYIDRRPDAEQEQKT